MATMLLAAVAACGGSDASGAGDLAAGSKGEGASGDAASGSSTSSATAGSGGVHTIHVRATADKGCVPDHTHLAAGGVTVNVTNVDATAVSEVEILSGHRIVGEKENLPPGLSGEFAVTLQSGEYTLYCPGASPERRTLTVTGKAAPVDESMAALLKTATGNYGDYVTTQVGYLLTKTKELNKTLHSGNLQKAKVAYAEARPFYEKIEPVAESFTVGKESLDADIDARINDVPKDQWSGFHRIEKGLFADESLKGLGEYGDQLVSDVKRLQKLVTDLTYQPTELANGAQELLDEVAASKITGEEERYSHIDLLDIANNVEGSEQAFAQLQPALKRIDPELTKKISQRFTALDELVGTYRSKTDPSGYVRYNALDTSDTRKLAAAVKAVQEPLSQVASKVAHAGR